MHRTTSVRHAFSPTLMFGRTGRTKSRTQLDLSFSNNIRRLPHAAVSAPRIRRLPPQPFLVLFRLFLVRFRGGGGRFEFRLDDVVVDRPRTADEKDAG